MTLSKSELRKKLVDDVAAEKAKWTEQRKAANRELRKLNAAEKAAEEEVTRQWHEKLGESLCEEAFLLGFEMKDLGEVEILCRFASVTFDLMPSTTNPILDAFLKDPTEENRKKLHESIGQFEKVLGGAMAQHMKALRAKREQSGGTSTPHPVPSVGQKQAPVVHQAVPKHAAQGR